MSEETTKLPARLSQVTKQVKVTEEYQLQFENALTTYFSKMEDWNTRIKNFKTEPITDEVIQKASDGRKLIAQTRLKAIDVIDAARKIIQTEMADYKNADTLWLRGKQTVEADCKAMEAELKEIEEFRIREEAAAKLKLKNERTEELKDLCNNPAIYPLGDMSEGDFQNLKAVLTDQFNRVQEAERQLAELEKEQEEAMRLAQEKLKEDNARLQRKQERVKTLMRIGLTYDPDPAFNVPSFNYPGGSMLESMLDELEDIEFDMLCAQATAAIKNAKEIEAQQKAEQEKVEAERQEKIAAQAKADQDRSDGRRNAMYALGLKFDGQQFSYQDINFHWTDLLTMSDEKFAKAVEGATKRMEQIRAEEALEAKKQLLAQQEQVAMTETLDTGKLIPMPDLPAPPVTGSMKSRLKAWLESLEFPEPPGEYTGKGLKEVKNARDGFEAWKLFVAERIEKL